MSFYNKKKKIFVIRIPCEPVVFCGWKGGYGELLQSEICYKAVPGVHLSFQEVLLINLLACKNADYCFPEFIHFTLLISKQI